MKRAKVRSVIIIIGLCVSACEKKFWEYISYAIPMQAVLDYVDNEE